MLGGSAPARFSGTPASKSCPTPGRRLNRQLPLVSKTAARAQSVARCQHWSLAEAAAGVGRHGDPLGVDHLAGVGGVVAAAWAPHLLRLKGGYLSHKTTSTSSFSSHFRPNFFDSFPPPSLLRLILPLHISPLSTHHNNTLHFSASDDPLILHFQSLSLKSVFSIFPRPTSSHQGIPLRMFSTTLHNFNFHPTFCR